MQDFDAQFIKSALTLRKLQSDNIIPRNMTPIQLTTQSIHYDSSSKDLNIRHLLASTRNIIYYGELNESGIPFSDKAICIFSDGSYYVGSFEAGKQNGRGKISNLQATYSYEGQWKNGLPHGLGKETIGRNIYEGEFCQGKKNGKGKQIYADGSYYDGEFKANVIEGEGKLYNKNNFWSGSWRNGYLEGSGKQIIAKHNLKDLKNASEYAGNFQNGERSGHGVFKWGQKYEYEGNFKKGQLNGEGTFKFKGKVYAGTWKNGLQTKITEVKQNNLSHSKEIALEQVKQVVSDGQEAKSVQIQEISSRQKKGNKKRK